MDILKPELVWVDGRCYRKNPLKAINVLRTDEEFDSFVDNMAYSQENLEDDDIDIEKTSHGYKATLNIANVYVGHILGKKGDTKRRIENETKTEIAVPRMGENKPVVIFGHVKSSVISAKIRIELIINSARQRQPFTHFLSLPLNGTIIKGKFLEFKDDVLRNCQSDRGINESLFQNPNKLHLTIGTLVLLTEQERNKAAEVLSLCQKEIIDKVLKRMPLLVEIRGLEYMNDDPANVDILYAKVCMVDGSNTLQSMCDCLVENFVKYGIMQKQYEKVKIHSTVMNTAFRKEKEEESISVDSNWPKARESFDARNILNLFVDYDFGKHRIESLHLSQRYSTAKDTSYYNFTANVILP